MNKKITIELFRDALNDLDVLLDSLSEEELDGGISIKAIGGFALIYHNVRTSGYTMDIDSVTPDYCHEVNKAILEVAVKKNIPSDWINNYNVLDGDTEVIEAMLDAFWDKVDWGLNHIQLWVADLETLLRSKLIAAEDDRETGRVQDFPDVVDILRKLECITWFDVQDLTESMDIDINVMYPENTVRLKKIFHITNMSISRMALR